MDHRSPLGEVMLRAARLDDAEAICAIHEASIRQLSAEHYSARQVDSWAHNEGLEPYEITIRDDTRHVVVAERDGTLAGWGRLDLNDGEVSAVYVHPDYAREGIGSTILEHLETVAREVGMERVHLLASLNAVPFYETAGFQNCGKTLQETSGGVIIECVEMEKELG